VESVNDRTEFVLTHQVKRGRNCTFYIMNKHAHAAELVQVQVVECMANFSAAAEFLDPIDTVVSACFCESKARGLYGTEDDDYCLEKQIRSIRVLLG
jgi:hypothetical protein